MSYSRYYMLLVDLSKVFGPLLDRIDIHVKVSALEIKDLKGGDTGETSAVLRDRVNEAREVQQRRLNGVASCTGTSTCTNAQMSGKQVKLYCQLDADADALLHQAMMEQGLSARGFNKILKIARTITDLEGKGSEKIGVAHISEAIQYRSLDRGLWR